MASSALSVVKSVVASASMTMPHRHAEAAEQAPGIESAAPPGGICRCPLR